MLFVDEYEHHKFRHFGKVTKFSLFYVRVKCLIRFRLQVRFRVRVNSVGRQIINATLTCIITE